jgi:hypothetical protein
MLSIETFVLAYLNWSKRNACASATSGHYRIVRGKTGHFLDFAAFDQIKISINQIFRCTSKHYIDFTFQYKINQKYKVFQK